MSEALSVAELLVNNADKIAEIILAASVILAIIIIIARPKEKIIARIINRRNAWWFAYLVLSAGIAFFLYFKGALKGLYLIATVLIWAVYGITCLISLKPKGFVGFTNPILRYLEKQLEKGLADQHADYFSRKGHWYLFTAEDKVEYHMLGCMYYAETNEYARAIEHLDRIKEEWLYDSEKEKIKNQRALLLVMMGSMKAASQLLGDPEKYESGDPMVWFAFSYICENAGDIDTAQKYCERSRDIVDAGYDAPKVLLAQVYNNYARIAVIKGNNQEASHYYDVAWKLAKESKDLRIIHIIASNRITHMALHGASFEKCEAEIKEYSELITKSSITNQIERYNLEVFIDRQFGKEAEAKELIRKQYNLITPHLDKTKQAVFTASTFRMLMNGKYPHDWFDKNVKSSMEMYKDMPLFDKLSVFKEYMSFYNQEEFRVVFNKRPYMGLQKKIIKYYREDALREIEEELQKIKNYEAFKYKNLMLHKLFILKCIEGKQHISKSQKQYVELYNELYDKGLHLDAVQVLLALVEECTSHENVMIKHPWWPEFMYISDMVDTATGLPEPKLEQDGIHLDYPHLVFMPPYIVRPLHEDVVKEHLDTIIAEFKSWKSHPYKLELCISIAHLLMCMDRKNEAKELLQYYENTGVSDLQMAAWARGILSDLRRELL